MPQKAGPRLDGRNGEIWRQYLMGRTQEAIADEYGIGQQRVSEVLAAVRESIGTADLADVARVDLERLDLMLSGVMPSATRGDTKAIGAAKGLLERRAKMLGLDATEPLTVLLTRRNDESGQLVAHALDAALSGLLAAVQTTPEHRRELERYAWNLAQRTLLAVGAPEDAELPPVPVAPRWPDPPPAPEPGVLQPSSVMKGNQEEPGRAEMQRWIEEYEAEHGPIDMGGDDEDAA